MLGQQHVAHHHHADQLPRLVDDVAISDDRGAGELAQRLGRLGDGDLRPEHGQSGRHEIGDDLGILVGPGDAGGLVCHGRETGRCRVSRQARKQQQEEDPHPNHAQVALFPGQR